MGDYLMRFNKNPLKQARLRILHLQLSLSFVLQFGGSGQAYHFQRDDIALLGLYKYFKEASEEEREHAYKFLEYMNKRGGRVVLTDIEAPPKQDWGTAQEAMSAALDLEKRVNEEQVDSIKEIGDNITHLKRVGEGLGVFMFDQTLRD
ncbi:hypothetical protein NQ314_001823 [Rhamnusium bicolor]|uniref:Ferritin n=1 Tax=Rhamnusium bicolor TaxID=1586634 RepID=A0AAV8ZT35_9CUCU|nr:hypothetical protein NQ314_001823 [Rhamnusium bicolor]